MGTHNFQVQLRRMNPLQIVLRIVCREVVAKVLFWVWSKFHPRNTNPLSNPPARSEVRDAHTVN